MVFVVVIPSPISKSYWARNCSARAINLKLSISVINQSTFPIPAPAHNKPEVTEPVVSKIAIFSVTIDKGVIILISTIVT